MNGTVNIVTSRLLIVLRYSYQHYKIIDDLHIARAYPVATHAASLRLSSPRA